MTTANKITTGISLPLFNTEIAPSTQTDTGLSFLGKRVYCKRYVSLTGHGGIDNVDTIIDGVLIDVWGYVERDTGDKVHLRFCETGTSDDSSAIWIKTTNILQLQFEGNTRFNKYDFCIFYYLTTTTADSFDGIPLISSGIAGLPLFQTNLAPSTKTDTGYTYAGDTVYFQRFTGTSGSTDGDDILATISPTPTRFLKYTGWIRNGLQLRLYLNITAAISFESNSYLSISGDDIVLSHKLTFNSRPYDVTVYWTE